MRYHITIYRFGDRVVQEVEDHVKDLIVIYFVISLKTISHIISKERLKVTPKAALQMAIDIDYMLNEIVF
jgi:hypothetical protein